MEHPCDRVHTYRHSLYFLIQRICLTFITVLVSTIINVFGLSMVLWFYGFNEKYLFRHYRFGIIISANMAKKNRTVWNRRPFGPIGFSMCKRDPNRAYVKLYVSGFATMKNTSADMKEYFAFNIRLSIYSTIVEDNKRRISLISVSRFCKAIESGKAFSENVFSPK